MPCHELSQPSSWKRVTVFDQMYFIELWNNDPQVYEAIIISGQQAESLIPQGVTPSPTSEEVSEASGFASGAEPGNAAALISYVWEIGWCGSGNNAGDMQPDD